MIAAAQRRVDRQQARLDEARKMVDAGVAARSYLAPFEAELTARQTSLDLAHLRAHLMADRAAMNQAPAVPPVIVPAPPDDSDLFAGRAWSTMKAMARSMKFRDLPPLGIGLRQQVRSSASDQRRRGDGGASRAGVRSSWARRRGRRSRRSGRRLAAAISSIAKDSLLRVFSRDSRQGHRGPHPHWSGKHTPGQSGDHPVEQTYRHSHA